MNKFFLAIRSITAPHIFALLLLSLLYILRPSYFGSIWMLIAGIFCLTVLPVLAYPLQRFIPPFKDKGRDGQRKLAIIFSFVGYLLGTLIVFIFNAPIEAKMLFVEYLLCGISIFVSDKAFKFKASGHACGIVGPIAMLVYLGLYIPAAVGILLSVPVFISSVKTKRHTVSQLIVGSLIPIVMLVIDHILFRVL